MSNGTDIAAEVAAGIAEAAESTGDGKLICVLRKIGKGSTPWDHTTDADNDSEVSAVQTKRTERDGSGEVRRTVQMLLIDATGSTPEKGDTVAIGVTQLELTESTRFARISAVNTLKPGGVALLHKVDLDD